MAHSRRSKKNALNIFGLVRITNENDSVVFFVSSPEQNKIRTETSDCNVFVFIYAYAFLFSFGSFDLAGIYSSWSLLLFYHIRRIDRAQILLC